MRGKYVHMQGLFTTDLLDKYRLQHFCWSSLLRFSLSYKKRKCAFEAGVVYLSMNVCVLPRLHTQSVLKDFAPVQRKCLLGVYVTFGSAPHGEYEALSLWFRRERNSGHLKCENILPIPQQDVGCFSAKYLAQHLGNHRYMRWHHPLSPESQEQPEQNCNHLGWRLRAANLQSRRIMESCSVKPRTNCLTQGRWFNNPLLLEISSQTDSQSLLAPELWISCLI